MISTPIVRAEALAQFGRQRLAGRRAQAQRDLAFLRQLGRSQHAGEAGGSAEEDRRLRVCDAAEPTLESGIRRGPLGHQDRGRAHAHRERQAVAQAVGEEQLGGGEADIALADAEQALAVELGRPVGIGVRMHRALGPAGRARRVEPEARVVAGRGSGRGQRRVSGDEGFEVSLAFVQRRDRMRDDDLLQLVLGLDHRRAQCRQQRARHQRSLGARMFEHVGVVVGGEQRVHRHRHEAGIHRAEKGDRPVIAVLHQQQHALFALQAERAQACGDTLHALGERAVGERAVVVDERSLASARGVELQQVLGEVEALGGCSDVGGAHGVCLLTGLTW